MPGAPPPNLIQKLKALRSLSNRPGSAAEGEAAYRQATNLKARLMVEFGMTDQEVEAAVSDTTQQPPPPPDYPPPDPPEEQPEPDHGEPAEDEPKRPKKGKKRKTENPTPEEEQPTFKVYKLKKNLFSSDLNLVEHWEHTLMDYASRRAGCWLNSPLKSGVLVGTSQEDLESALLFYTLMREEIMKASKSQFPAIFQKAFKAIGLPFLSSVIDYFETFGRNIYLEGIAKGHEIFRLTHKVSDDFEAQEKRSTLARKLWLTYINE